MSHNCFTSMVKTNVVTKLILTKNGYDYTNKATGSPGCGNNLRKPQIRRINNEIYLSRKY